MKESVNAQRIKLALVLTLLLGAVTAVYVRANTWACGRFGSSGCVSSVRLEVGALGLEPGTASVDSDSLGSVYLFEGYSYDYRKRARGVRRFVPPPFRRLGAVVIRKAQNPELLTHFSANKRFYDAAWSRDGAYVGLSNQDLNLDVFAVNTP